MSNQMWECLVEHAKTCVLSGKHYILLDYSIRGPLTPSISPEFYGWTDRGGSSSMILKSKSWVQFSLVT
jgi:hypothetical protein